jgi:hypothetical protein
MPAATSLPAMLSQLLIAFTIEFDNEFERQMGEAGYPGARLSLIVWANLMRFVGEGLSVSDLTAAALAPANRIKAELGCLERWGVITLVQDLAHRRAGWGTGRGIRADWIARLTSKGLTASNIWPPLALAIQQKWETRFGADEIKTLRNSLHEIVTQLDIELPEGLPAGLEKNEAKYPPRVTRTPTDLPLPALLSQLLLAFRLEFERESPTSLALCANALRVLGDESIPAREIPVRTGASPETSGIGWQLKPYITITPGLARNQGQLVRLSPRGLIAQHKYYELTAEIEQRWNASFGAKQSDRLIAILRTLLDHRNLAEGLIPPKGTARAGEQTPALGRRDVGVAARQRLRDLVSQTEAFVRDPAGTLPHYPLWDMNRGFGP